ncbi:TetR/AcrR family transcriptional regulator [Brachybacterium sp. EF45031]|uniref:TetR/AcrR family transcriptional regulator n=1 Tax=Brachybacterium sillae TaxID=2810536 RepID=UPI00217E5D3D|nr:TetR/AcrR family transcriptional regulator [Brachybacterium sillae]MCS6712450.1 TetR/AcrR family transcriptional regulator [Brachybacterium sillae]
MAPTPRMPKAQRRAQLLATALEQFTHSGYQTVSMDDIALAAGVTKPVLYQHFESKEALYRAVVQEIGERMVATVSDLGARAGTTEERVRAGVQHFHDLTGASDALRLFAGADQPSDEARDLIREVLDRTALALADVLGRSREMTDQEALVIGHAALANAQTAALLMRRTESAEQQEQILSTVTRLIVGGLQSFAPRDEPLVGGEVTAADGTARRGTLRQDGMA